MGWFAMQTFTLSDVRNRHGEVFDRAIAEPVAVTKKKRRTHVIMPAALFEAMLAQVFKLEDQPLRDGFDKFVAEIDDSKYERQMALGRQGMARYRNALRALAKE
jgi:prevent-host-death family protein